MVGVGVYRKYANRYFHAHFAYWHVELTEAVQLSTHHVSAAVRKEGDRIRLVFNKLFINSETYEWDSEADRATRVTRSDSD